MIGMVPRWYLENIYGGATSNFLRGEMGRSSGHEKEVFFFFSSEGNRKLTPEDLGKNPIFFRPEVFRGTLSPVP